MISQSKNITDFVDKTVLASEDPKETNLPLLDTALGEKARLKNLKDMILSDEKVPDSFRMLSPSIAESEQAAEESIMSFLPTENKDSPYSNILWENAVSIWSMDNPLSKAGEFLATSAAEVQEQFNCINLKSDKYQCNAMKIKENILEFDFMEKAEEGILKTYHKSKDLVENPKELASFLGVEEEIINVIDKASNLPSLKDTTLGEFGRSEGFKDFSRSVFEVAKGDSATKLEEKAINNLFESIPGGNENG